jgi:DNA-binding NarL/FixJ family response regulator
LNGLDAVEQIRRAGCDAKVIFLTMHKDAVYAARAQRVGASGFVLKHSASTELLTALRRVLEGRTYVTPQIAELLERLPAMPARGTDELLLLTPRQREVLQLYAEGYSAKDVANDPAHLFSDCGKPQGPDHGCPGASARPPTKMTGPLGHPPRHKHRDERDG